MEMDGSDTGMGYEVSHWWWAMGSAAQLGWGIRAIWRGYVDDTPFMPLKAFGVASLFVGSLAAASMGTLRVSGIHKVDDLKELGQNIRTNMGVPQRNNTG